MFKKFKNIILVLVMLLSITVSFNAVVATNKFDRLVGDSGTMDGKASKDMVGDSVSTNLTLPDIMGNIIKLILGLSGTVALIFVIWAGLDIINAKGDSGKIKESSKKILTAIIGIAIIAASYALTDFLLNQVAGVIK